MALAAEHCLVTKVDDCGYSEVVVVIGKRGAMMMGAFVVGKDEEGVVELIN